MIETIFEITDISYAIEKQLIKYPERIIIKKGEKVLLSGESGSGKSTLLKMLSLFINDYNGIIKYKGEDIKTIKNYQNYRRSVQYMTQETPVLSETYVKNFPDEINQFSVYRGFDFDFKVFVDLLNRFGLDKSTLEKKMGDLSIGEKQRVVLSRIIGLKPSVLLLDEPTSALDEQLARIVFDYLLNNLNDITLVCVSHTKVFFNDFTSIIHIGRV